MHLLFLLGVLGCAPESQGACVAELSLLFPTGEQSNLDFCAGYTLEADYEFDPDDTPEVRDATLGLASTLEEGFECWVQIREGSTCGTGSYLLGDGDTHVTMSIADCAGVPDAYEGMSEAIEGLVTLEVLDAGDSPGNFTGEPLATRIAGTLAVTDAAGVVLGGAFDVTYDVIAGDAEESGCVSPE